MSQLTNLMTSRGALTLRSSDNRSFGLASARTEPGKRTSHAILVAKHVLSRTAYVSQHHGRARKRADTVFSGDGDEVVSAVRGVEHQGILKARLPQIKLRRKRLIHMRR